MSSWAHESNGWWAHELISLCECSSNIWYHFLLFHFIYFTIFFHSILALSSFCPISLYLWYHFLPFHYIYGIIFFCFMMSMVSFSQIYLLPRWKYGSGCKIHIIYIASYCIFNQYIHVFPRWYDKVSTMLLSGLGQVSPYGTNDGDSGMCISSSASNWIVTRVGLTWQGWKITNTDAHLHVRHYSYRYMCTNTHTQTHIHIQVNLDMTDHCATDLCIWRTICLVPVRFISSIHHMYTTDFAYDGPIFLVPLSPSYPSSPVHISIILICEIFHIFTIINQLFYLVSVFNLTLIALHGSICAHTHTFL